VTTRLALGRALGVTAQLCAAGLLLTSAWLIVRAAQQPPVLFLMVAIVGVRFFGVARTVLRYAERLLTHDVALGRVVALRLQVYRALEQRAGHIADSGRRGELIHQVVSDVDAVQDRLLRIRGPWIVAWWTVAVVSGAVALIEPWSGLVVLIGSMLSMLAVRWLGGVSAGDDLTAERNRLAGELSQIVTAGPDLVVAGLTAAHDTVERIAAVERLETRAAWRTGRARAAVTGVTAAVVGLVASATSAVDPVLVGVVVLAPLALAEPLEALADAERLRPDVTAAERRLRALIESAPVVAEPEPTAPDPTEPSLRVSGVTIGWDRPLVDDVTFELPPGGAVAVTGPSGAGKSTLGLTLTGFVPPLGGRIEVGGVDAAALGPARVRRLIGRLGQDEMVFDTTVRENLRIAAPDADDARLEAALGDVGLGEWLASTADGLDARVGEHGAALSGGERQRLCLARLLLGGHRIWVLDEPAEHLDDRAAEALLEDLLALRPRVGLVVITHDPRVVAAIGHQVRLEAGSAVPAI